MQMMCHDFVPDDLCHKLHGGQLRKMNKLVLPL